MAGLEAFRAMAGASVTHVVLSLPLVVLGALYSGLTGAVVGLVLSAVAAAIVSRVILIRVCQRAGLPLWKRPQTARRHYPVWVFFACSVQFILERSRVLAGNDDSGQPATRLLRVGAV